MRSRSTTLWTFAITSVALFMVTLDNLVVTSALPVIRRNLHASLTQLEWTVNAYTLTFAVLLLTGAALGDRYGRRLMFSIGIGVFTLGSAVAALSTTATGLDLAGLGLASAGLLGIVWGLVRGNSVGWSSPEIVGSLVAGAVLLALFVLWELRAPAPMLPMRFFRNRTFALTNVSSLFMFFGMFGSIFLLIQFFQTVQSYSPLQAGLRILPWTAMPIFIAPIAGARSDRIGGQRLMAAGLALQAIGLAWIATVSSPTMPYSDVVAPFFLSGIGMALFFAPVANVVLSAVRPEEEGQASGANNAIRELGGVFGVAVLASIFAHYGGYGAPQHFVDGLRPAVWVGAGLVGVGALAALAIPGRRREAEAPEPAFQAAS